MSSSSSSNSITSASSKASTNDASQNIKYNTGEQAILLDQDGCGFCYYKNGRVAICISKVNAYHRRYFVYEDNKLRSLLCSLDENIVGSAGRADEGQKLVLTKDGGMISDHENNLLKTWRWDPKSQNAGSIPDSPITLILNHSIEFSFTDRKNVSIKFSNLGVSLDLDCGAKQKRHDNYLEHASRKQGKLVVATSNVTLIDRQRQAFQESVEARTKSKPKSSDIKNQGIKDVISNLESDFESYGQYRVTAAPERGWKAQAHAQTLSEVPVLKPTGHEVGKQNNVNYEENQKSVLKANAMLQNEKTSSWLGSAEIHQRLAASNPVLPRPAVLNNASGRYSVDAKPGRVPESPGLGLYRLTASNFTKFLNEECPSDQVVLVACLREDDRSCRSAEKSLEVVNEQIVEGKVESENSFRIVKFEMSESNFLNRRYNIQALPTFLLFYGGNLVDVTSLGGAPVRVNPTTKNAHLVTSMDYLPKILLLEPEFKKQIAVEKVLKKEKFQWDLAMTGSEGVSHAKRFSSNNNTSDKTKPYGIVLLSDKLSRDDASLVEKTGTLCVVIITKLSLKFSARMCTLCRASTGKRKQKTSIDRSHSICPHCGIVADANDLLEPPFSSIADVAIYKTVKAATLHRIAEIWKQKSGKSPQHTNFKGMTRDAIVRQLQDSLKAGRRGRFMNTSAPRPMTLSSLETTAHGVDLIKR